MDSGFDDSTGQREWFPEHIAGVSRLNRAECSADLDRIHTNLARIEERPSIDTETRVTKKARTIEKIMANVPTYQLMREEHSTLRSALDQLRSDIANFKDATAQTRKHTLLAQRERASFQLQTEVLRENFRFEAASSDAARHIYTVLSEYLAQNLTSFYATRTEAEVRCKSLAELRDQIIKDRADRMQLVMTNSKLEVESSAIQVLFSAMLQRLFDTMDAPITSVEDDEKEEIEDSLDGTVDSKVNDDASVIIPVDASHKSGRNNTEEGMIDSTENPITASDSVAVSERNTVTRNAEGNIEPANIKSGNDSLEKPDTAVGANAEKLDENKTKSEDKDDAGTASSVNQTHGMGDELTTHETTGAVKSGETKPINTETDATVTTATTATTETKSGDDQISARKIVKAKRPKNAKTKADRSVNPAEELRKHILAVFTEEQLRLFRILFDSFNDAELFNEFVLLFSSVPVESLLSEWTKMCDEKEAAKKLLDAGDSSTTDVGVETEKEKSSLSTTQKDQDTTSNESSIVLTTEKVENNETNTNENISTKDNTMSDEPSTSPSLSSDAYLDESRLYLISGQPTGLEGLSQAARTSLHEHPQMLEMRRQLLQEHTRIVSRTTGMFDPLVFVELLHNQASRIVTLQQELVDLDLRFRLKSDEWRVSEFRISGLQSDLSRALAIVEALRLSLEQGEVEKQLIAAQVQASDAKLEYLQQEIAHIQTLRTGDEAKLHSLVECVQVSDQRATDAEMSLAETAHELRITQTANESLQDAYDRLLDERNAFARTLIYISDELASTQAQMQSQITTGIPTTSASIGNIAPLSGTALTSTGANVVPGLEPMTDVLGSASALAATTPASTDISVSLRVMHELQIKLSKYMASNRLLSAELRVAEDSQRLATRENKKLQKQLNDITGATSITQIDVLDTLEPRLRAFGQSYNPIVHAPTVSLIASLSQNLAAPLPSTITTTNNVGSTGGKVVPMTNPGNSGAVVSSSSGTASRNSKKNPTTTNTATGEEPTMMSTNKMAETTTEDDVAQPPTRSSSSKDNNSVMNDDMDDSTKATKQETASDSQELSSSVSTKHEKTDDNDNIVVKKE